jgi:1-deoxy-D-xylulose-5-phosphate reductoisomerase
MKNIVILGSTGSIGRSALDVVSMFPDRFKVVGLAAGKNSSLLLEQIKQFRPKVVAVSNEKAYKELKDSLKGQGERAKGRDTEILFGTEGISLVAAMQDADTVISAIVGSAGLLPTIAAIKAGKVVALANKETLVMAGDLVMSSVKEYGATLLPVDSEHSAIFQCISGYEKCSIKKIILTASGGPFAGKTMEELEHVSPESALRHPNWSMGRKITIDSATLMNKGLEVIEAHYLFGLPPERIDVLIHPQSIVHSIVEFIDGSYIAQLSRPDMKGPIAYALSYPKRLYDVIETIDWEGLSGLTFQKPDHRTFPCLSLAYSALKTGGTMPAVLNASNEIAVVAFLDGIIGFNRIPVIIKKVMDSHKLQPADDIDVILEADRWAREETKSVIGL